MKKCMNVTGKILLASFIGATMLEVVKKLHINNIKYTK